MRVVPTAVDVLGNAPLTEPVEAGSEGGGEIEGFQADWAFWSARWRDPASKALFNQGVDGVLWFIYVVGLYARWFVVCALLVWER